MPDRDSIILSLAAPQHGAVARWQLTAAGVPAAFIELRLRQRRMQRLHRCVYCIIALKGERVREMAAVLSCGRHAVASHLSAADIHWQLGRRSGDMSVSVARGNPRGRPGVRIHRVRLLPDDVTREAGVPVTTPVRTLLDLADVAPERVLEQAMAQAFRRDATAEAALGRSLDRSPHRPGAPRLRALLAAESPPALTRSEAEERFLALVRRARLPVPATNARIAGFEVDAYWRAERLVVEVDGLEHHGSRSAMRRDRRRDAALLAAGLRVMRVTWADLTDESEAMLARLAQALVQPGYR